MRYVSKKINRALFIYQQKKKEFGIVFNCSALASKKASSTAPTTSYDFFDLSLNINFRLNNTRLLLELQLVAPPPITLSIHFRKHCSNDSFSLLHGKRKSAPYSSASTSFTIAYIIIATLVAFLLIILCVTISMCVSSKYKIKQINTKYESLKQIRTKSSVVPAKSTQIQHVMAAKQNWVIQYNKFL